MDFLTLPFLMSAITALVSGVFAVLMLRRWWNNRREGRSRPHQLAWGIGITLYFLGSFSQMVLALVWSPFFFGLWYWAGALMVAPWLGQGTVYLLLRRGNIARNIHMALLLVAVMTLPWTLFLTPFNPDAWHPGADLTQIYLPQVDRETGEIIRPGIMPAESRGTVRFFVPITNVWGTIALVGGAVYSAWLFRRKQIMSNRVLGNWLIAAGGLLPALGGAFIRLGVPDLQYPGTLLGVILIFVGFLMATNVPEDAKTPKHRLRSDEPVSESAGLS